MIREGKLVCFLYQALFLHTHTYIYIYIHLNITEAEGKVNIFHCELHSFPVPHKLCCILQDNTKKLIETHTPASYDFNISYS